MQPTYLEFSLNDGVATITLNRPNEGNTFHQGLADELDDVARFCLMSDDILVVVLKASGKLFSGGGDLSYMQSNAEHIDIAIKKLADRLHSAFSSLARMPAPMIVSVQGTAAGIGLSLALQGDLTIVSDKAKFAAAYGGVGLSPDGGLTYQLPRVVGIKKAKEFLLTNRVLTAEQAYDWGMVNEVVSHDVLDQRVNELVETLKTNAPTATQSVKSLLIQSQNESMEAQMHLEGIQLSLNASSENGQEGINAFLDQRKPEFKTKIKKH